MGMSHLPHVDKITLQPESIIKTKPIPKPITVTIFALYFIFPHVPKRP